MPAKSIEPLKKCTVDLFLADADYLSRHVENFTEEVREAVRVHVNLLRGLAERSSQRMTIGDLDDDR